MKTFVFSAVAMAVLASCTNSAIDDVVNNDEPVAIRLTAGVQVSASATRAAIDNNSTFTASVFGWEVVKDANPEYATATPWTSLTGDIKASNTGNESVSLLTKQHYQTNGDKTYIKAISPAGGSINNGSYTFGTALTGKEDVLLTKTAVAGSRSDATVALSFSHILTRFNFKVIKGEHFDSDVQVTGIKINGANIAESINLADNTITSKAVDDGIAISISGVTIGATELPAGDQVMIVPCLANTLTLDITTNKMNYSGVTVKPASGDNFVEGTSYTITLTFNDKKVGATAAVTEWSDETGSGTVE